MELGLGIHGEPGAKTAPLQPVDDIVKQVILVCQVALSLKPYPIPKIYLVTLNRTAYMIQVTGRQQGSTRCRRGMVSGALGMQ